MKFYAFPDIKAAADCTELAAEVYGATVRNGRCNAAWRGGDGTDNVSIERDKWYDHVAKTGGGPIELAAFRFNGDIQATQEFLGERYSLTPRMVTGPQPEPTACRYATLKREGYKEVARYEYCDLSGAVRHATIRMEHRDRPGKEFVQCVPSGNNGQRWTLKGVDTILYRLPEISDSDWVLICEGEKAADRLAALGVPATTAPMGSGKWSDSYSAMLAGKDVAIAPDNDAPGIEHAQLVARSLHGIAKSVKIVGPLSNRDKGGIDDWLDEDAGRDAAAVLQAISDAPEWRPLPACSGLSEGKPWHGVLDGDVGYAIRGSVLEPLVEALRAPTTPPLPITLTLPKALSLAGCALCKPVPILSEDAARAVGIERARVRIQTSGGQACNMWTLTGADSSEGKDIGGVVHRLARRQGFYLGDAGSAEGVADALTENGHGLLCISELKNWIDPTHWQHKAASFLTSAWSSGSFSVRLSARDKAQRPRESDYCFPSIVANIQPHVMERLATATDLTSGFMGRFLFCKAEAFDGRPTNADYGSLVDDANETLCALGNKTGVVHVMDGYLQDLYDEFQRGGARYRSVWKRYVNEYGPRLALMLSISKEDKRCKIEITPGSWEKAALLLRWFYSHAEKLLQGVEDDPETKRSEMRLRVIREFIKNNPGCMKRDISHRCSRNSTSKERSETLDELVDRGLIELKKGLYFAR